MLFISNKFNNYLKQIIEVFNDPIAEKLLSIQAKSTVYNDLQDLINRNIITEYAKYLDIDDTKILIKFLPKGKQLIFDNNNKINQRNWSTGKIARVLHKSLVTQFTDTEYENFVNHLKSIIQVKDFSWSIVSGELIKYWYNYQNYAITDGGTLRNSCMRSLDYPDQLQIYTNNQYCTMLILTKYDKLFGRALIWTIDGNTYMDRIYYTDDNIYSMFIQYAKTKHWCTRENNSLLDDEDNCYFIDSNGDVIDDPICIPVATNYEHFPYLDSFRYYFNNGTTAYLTNFLNYKDISCIKYLSDSEGYYNGFCVCYGCDEELCPDDCYYSSILDAYLCYDCGIWSDYHDSYICIDDSIQVFYDQEQSRYDYIISDYIYSTNIVNINGAYYFYDEDIMIEIDGEYYFYDDVEYDEINDTYKLI